MSSLLWFAARLERMKLSKPSCLGSFPHSCGFYQSAQGNSLGCCVVAEGASACKVIEASCILGNMTGDSRIAGMGCSPVRSHGSSLGSWKSRTLSMGYLPASLCCGTSFLSSVLAYTHREPHSQLPASHSQLHMSLHTFTTSHIHNLTLTSPSFILTILHLQPLSPQCCDMLTHLLTLGLCEIEWFSVDSVQITRP